MAPDAGPKGKAAGGFDLLDHFERFLAEPPPQSLLITGSAGTGKSTLVRTLLPRLKGQGIFVAYRSEPDRSPGDGAAGSGPVLSLLLVDPEGERNGEGAPAPSDPAGLMSFAPASARSEEAFPTPILSAVQRMVAAGGGFVVVDTWDPSTEREFRSRAGDSGAVEVITTTTPIMRAKFGRLPIRGIFVVAEIPDGEMRTAADGIVELGWEELDGFRLRVISIPKLRDIPAPESRYLYSLDGGDFHCPPQLPIGFRPPIGPPEPDPAPDDASLFPGSSAFVNAFGRLRFHGLTGLQVPPRFSGTMGDVFLYPVVAHALSIGGRAVWIPSAASSPGQILAQLSRWIPADFLRERLRIVTPWGPDPGLGEFKSVALPIRRAPDDGRDVRSVVAPGVGPLFPDAFRFLQATPEGRPTLYVIYIDGVRALASIAGAPLNPETFPMIVSGYARLPRFHGFGFGRSDDPVIRVLAASLDTHIQIEEKYGRTVLLGIRPRTHPYILDWDFSSGRYELLPMK